MIGRLAACCLLAVIGSACSPAPRVDLIVRGGTLVDGTGAPPRTADVAILGDRIHSVGRLRALRAEREIDATGLVVSPGFVDMHSHADLILLADRPTQERLLGAKIAQGVTTVIVGNCGLGTAPATDHAAKLLEQINGWMTPDGVTADAGSVGRYLDRLERGGVALNAGTLVPHGPVRISAMGLSPGAPGPAELDSMRRSIRRSLDEGAYGLSTGLIYPPGMFSATDELIELARVVADRDALFTAHVRGSSETLARATQELIDIGDAGGARVHHSHLEAVGEPFWEDVGRVLAAEDAARSRGLTVTHDVFPYTRAATMMSAIFPPWALEDGLPGLLRRLGDTQLRRRIASDIAGYVPQWPPWRDGGWPHNLVGAVGWDGIRVASVTPSGPGDWVGLSLAEIAAREARDPFDVVADLMLAEGGRVGQLVDEISGRGELDPPLLSILTHPSAAIISDAEDYGRGRPHPAHAGAFARALRLNRERSLMPLESLVHRMTAHPAKIVGLGDRGVIRAGAYADLVVLDPRTVRDRATWDRPRERADGIPWVVLNGAIVVERGRYVGGLRGRVLRAGAD